MISPCKIPHIRHGLAVLRRGLLVQRHGRGAARQQSWRTEAQRSMHQSQPPLSARKASATVQSYGVYVSELCVNICIYILYMEKYHGRSYVIYLFSRYK